MDRVSAATVTSHCLSRRNVSNETDLDTVALVPFVAFARVQETF